MDLRKLLSNLMGTKNAKKKRTSETLSFDLLYQLSYMSVIASAGVPRSQIFEHAALIPCACAEYFRHIQIACVRLKYDYAKACRLVGEAAEEEEVKGLLLRFSTSLVSGEPEAEFLAREAEAQAEAYQNEYGRKLETLKLWTDAYVSLILSAVLVIIVGVVSTMIWKIQTMFIVGMAMIACVTAALGIWLIYLMAPRETVVRSKPSSKEQKLTSQALRLAAPIAIAAGAIIAVMRIDLGWALIAIAFFSLPVGVISMIDDRMVLKRDRETGAFLRSLGGVCGAIGTTVKDGLSRLDLEAMNGLKREVKRLHVRLTSGITPRLCWGRFIEETGSELAGRAVGMFYDAIDLGGAPEKAGYHASLYANKVAMLRARRKTVSSPFGWLSIAMHGAVVGLLVFITEVIGSFGSMIVKASTSMPKISGAPSMGSFVAFNFSGLELMRTLVLPLVIMFTIANALAPSIADGGSRYKLLYELGITALISGASLVILPVLARQLFSGVGM